MQILKSPLGGQESQGGIQNVTEDSNYETTSLKGVEGKRSEFGNNYCL